MNPRERFNLAVSDFRVGNSRVFEDNLVATQGIQVAERALSKMEEEPGNCGRFVALVKATKLGNRINAGLPSQVTINNHAIRALTDIHMAGKGEAPHSPDCIIILNA